MSEKITDKQKLFNSSEEAVSMVLGLVIVIVIVGLIFNFFQKRKGSVSLPGITTSTESGKKAEVAPTVKEEKVESVLGENEYVIKPGDSLWKIAALRLGSGYGWTKIASLNGMKNPGVLAVGQKIKLPEVVETKLAGEAKIQPSTSEYIAAKGDSLWKIAVKNYSNGYAWVEIWEANKKVVLNPNKLYVGTKLTLPKLTK